MKKSLALGIAGITAVVVAAWRQVQRDNTIEPDPAGPAPARPAPASSAPKSSSGTEPASTSEQPHAARAASALFTPSVSEKSTKAELYEVATELGIEGRSKMNKSELLTAIRAAS